MPTAEANARRALEQLVAKYEALSQAEREDMTEAGVVRQFIDFPDTDGGWERRQQLLRKYDEWPDILDQVRTVE